MRKCRRFPGRAARNQRRRARTNLVFDQIGEGISIYGPILEWSDERWNGTMKHLSDTHFGLNLATNRQTLVIYGV